MDSPQADCVFCNLEQHVKEYERYGSWHFNGYPIYKIVPLNPVTKGHVLFVPHTHVAAAEHHPLLTGQVFAAAADYAQTQKWQADFNLITSSGSAATQSVFHLHVHYVPRTFEDGLRLPWDRRPCEGCG